MKFQPTKKQFFYLLNIAGIYIEEISSTIISNYMDELCWSSTIICFHRVRTTQTSCLDHWFQYWSLVYIIWRKGSLCNVINNLNQIFLRSLLSIVSWQGVVMSGLVIFIQLWCTEEKGPVFVTMFNPLSTILVAVLAYFIFGERLYMGR